MHARLSRTRAARYAVTALVALFALAVASSALASSPLTWSAPVQIDGMTSTMSAISCPSTTLCVLTDFMGGNVFTSNSPTGGAADWSEAHIDGVGFLTGTSCPSTTLCVLGEGTGHVVTSTDPTGGTAAWTVAGVDGSNFIESVSCSSESLCVAVDSAGNVVTSTDPTGGAGAWSVANVDGANAIDSISCRSSTTLCVAVDSAGNVVTSTDPTGGAGAWTVTSIDGTTGLPSVSCPASSTLCAAVDSAGNVLTSTDPTGGAGAWSATPLGHGLGGVACPTASLCVATVLEFSSVMSSTDPTGGAAQWSSTDTGTADLVNVGCASDSLCLVDSGQGQVAAGTPGSPSGGTAPTATTQAAGEVSLTSATVHGQVRTGGQATSWHFEYGTTGGYGHDTPGDTVPGSTVAAGVSATLTGLSPNTVYHYRLVAHNASGDATGDDMTFTTPAPPPPVVSGLAPASGPSPGGTRVTIAGSHLQGATAVSFGGVPAASFHVDSDAQISATAPAHATGAVDVTVTTPDGTSAAGGADRFVYVGPRITSVSPNPGPASGGKVTISGQDLGGATVTVGGQPATTTLDTPSEILIELPPGEGVAPIVVHNSDGTAGFSYSRYSYPTLVSISPEHGRDTGGYRASVTGTNLRTGDQVRFGGAVATLQARSSTEGALTVPSGTGEAHLTVDRPAQPTGQPNSPVTFDYVPKQCGNGKCFLAWAQAGLTEGSTSITDYQPDGAVNFDDTESDPATGTSGAWWCAFPGTPECRLFSSGPVLTHITHSTIGANGGASAQASPFGSVVDLSAAAQGPVAWDGDNQRYAEANGYTDNSAAATGHTLSQDGWEIEPQPTTKVPVYVAVSTSTRAIISSSDLNPWESDAKVGWQLTVGSSSGAFASASGSEHYFAKQDEQHGVTRFIDENTLAVGGHPAPGGATTTLTVGPIDIEPSQWNSVTVDAAIDGAVKVSCGAGDSASLCTASARGSVDPVVISADPRYRIVSRAPGHSAGHPLVLSSSRLSARRGQRLTLGGSGFGRHRGRIVLTHGKRRIVARPSAWSSREVTVRVPRQARLGGLYVSVRSAGGKLSNPVPLMVHGRRPAPLVGRLSRHSARPGARLTISGRELGGARSVRFGSRKAHILRRRAGSLTVVVPKGTGVVNVTVTSRGGPSAATTADIFRYAR